MLLVFLRLDCKQTHRSYVSEFISCTALKQLLVSLKQNLHSCGKFEAKQNLQLRRTQCTMKEKIVVSTKKFPKYEGS